MNYARINRAIAIAEATEAAQAEHADRVRAAREAAQAERSREHVEPPELSGGLDPHGIGGYHSPTEISQWHRSLSGAAERAAEPAARRNAGYYPSKDRR